MANGNNYVTQALNCLIFPNPSNKVFQSKFELLNVNPLVRKT